MRRRDMWTTEDEIEFINYIFSKGDLVKFLCYGFSISTRSNFGDMDREKIMKYFEIKTNSIKKTDLKNVVQLLKEGIKIYG